MDEEPKQSARPLERAIGSIGKVLGATTLVTGVLYYFGWARTNAAAAEVGIDQSMLGFSTTDYVLRAVDPMFRPLGVSLFAVLLIVLGGRALDQLVTSRHHRWSRRSVELGMALGVVAAVAAIAIAADQLEDVRAENVQHLSAMLLVVGATLLWYVSIASRTLSGFLATTARQNEHVVGFLIVVLALIATFAIVTREAHEDGTSAIDDFRTGFDHEPDVVLTSHTPLDIMVDGVDETVLLPLGGADGTSRYRYTGTKLLLEANDRLFLVTAGFAERTGASTVIVVPQSAGLRIDLVTRR